MKKLPSVRTAVDMKKPCGDDAGYNIASILCHQTENKNPIASKIFDKRMQTAVVESLVVLLKQFFNGNYKSFLQAF